MTIIMTPCIGTRGKALSLLNRNAKKRKRPEVKEKRPLALDLSQVKAAEIDCW